jgi:hypothetical protein
MTPGPSIEGIAALGDGARNWRALVAETDEADGRKLTTASVASVTV